MPRGQIQRGVPEGFTVRPQSDVPEGFTVREPQQQREMGFVEREVRGIPRQIALTGRALAEGVVDLASPFADPLAVMMNKGAEMVGSDYRFPTDTSAHFSQTLTNMGVPEPQGGIERGVNIAGRITTGVAGGRGLDRMATRALGINAPATAPTPSVDELRQMANQAYKAADDAGVVISQSRFGSLADDITRTVRDSGYHPRIHPKISAALDEIAGHTAGDISFPDLELLRRVVKSAAGSVEADERRIARVILDKLDDFAVNMTQADVVAGNADEAGQVIGLARNLWSRMSKGQVIEDMIESARNRAGQFSQSGMENAIRTEFRQLARNSKRMRMFTPDERSAIELVARGGPVGNTLRMLGKFAPHGLVSTVLGGGAGYSIAGGPGAAAVMALGEGARLGATRSTMNNARAVSELVRRGAPAVSPPAAGAPGVIGAVPAVQNAMIEPFVNYLMSAERDYR